MEQENIELIKKAKSGDSKSLDELIIRYRPLVISISRKYFLIGGSDDDLIQEGNIGLFKAIMSYDENKNSTFYSYSKLCIERNIMTAINQANNLKNKSLVSSESIDDEVFEDNFDDGSPSPEQKLIMNEIMEELKDDIKKNLTILEKQVLYYFIKGKSYSEISSILQVSVKSVDNALGRIRKKLDKFKKI